MTEELRRHLPTIVVVALLGIIATVFALSQVRASMAGDAEALSLAVFVVPCVAMVACSFVVMLTASAIGRQLFLAVTGICFVAGIVAMVATSGWFAGTDVTPPLQNPIIVMRDIAAYIVAPTVGSIAGAWLGSRIHPMAKSK